MKNKKWWESSVDQGEVSMRIKGVLISLLPLLVLADNLFQFNIGEENLKELVDALVSLVTSLTLVAGVATTIHGHIRRKK